MAKGHSSSSGRIGRLSMELSLVFEEGQQGMIGDYNKYPDIFVHLAKEGIELTGTDILNLKAIGDEHLKIYEV